MCFEHSFNPLAGIRCFLTHNTVFGESLRRMMCFNPLAGIRCFLTQTFLDPNTPLDKLVSIP